MIPYMVKCWNCGMTFRVGEPSKRADFSRCAEPRCGKRHWSAENDGRTVIVGVLPADKDMFTPVHVPNR